MIFTITTKYKLIGVINIYRPDYSKKNKINSGTFLKEFSKLLDEITSLPGILVITGDFNIHMESLDNKYTIELVRGILIKSTCNEVYTPEWWLE